METGKILEEYGRIIEKDGKKIWETVFRKELTDDEIIHNVSFLRNNIKTLKEELSGLDIDEQLKILSEKLDIERDIQREALLNFDKYMSQMFKDLRANKDKTRKDIQKYLANFETSKKMRLNNLFKQLKAKEINLTIQLKNDTEQIEVYKGYDGKEDCKSRVSEKKDERKD